MSKKHKLTLSPIPQVDGLLEMSIDANQVVSTKVAEEPLDKELSPLPKENPKKYYVHCYNKNGITPLMNIWNSTTKLKPHVASLTRGIRLPPL